MEGDPHQLERFVEAQAHGVYERALDELRSGRKQTHWMWFIFPQHRDLGKSETALFFGLSGVAEASAYLDHPVLGPRLRQCAEAVLIHLQAGSSAQAIFGPVDALKLRSSMAIFQSAAPKDDLFRQVIDVTNGF